MFLEKNKRVLLSLSARLTLSYFAFFTLTLGVVFASLYYVLSVTLQKNDHELISAEHDELVLAYNRDGISGLINTVEGKNPDTEAWLFVQVISKNGATLFKKIPLDSQEYDVSKLVAPSSLESKEQNLSLTQKQWINLSRTDTSDELEVLSQKLKDGSLLQVGRRNDDRNAELSRLQRSFFILTTPLLLLALIGGYLVSYRSLAPIRNLISAVKKIEAGDLSPRVSVPSSRDELFELSILFNSMLMKINTLIEGMRRTVDNVAHDLRTPLTQFRSSADLALGNENLLSDQQKISTFREALIDGIESSEKIQILIDSVMDITQAESGTLKLNKVDTDLNIIVLEIIDLYQIVCDEKSVQIEFSEVSLKRVELDPLHFRRVIANLLDNALKYSPNHSTVKIDIAQSTKNSTLRITNQGPGISAEDLPYIWDRLFRADRSRSEKGLGLGLTIVKAIVQAHGGTVACNSSSEETSFYVTLPMSV